MSRVFYFEPNAEAIGLSMFYDDTQLYYLKFIPAMISYQYTHDMYRDLGKIRTVADATTYLVNLGYRRIDESEISRLMVML